MSCRSRSSRSSRSSSRSSRSSKHEQKQKQQKRSKEQQKFCPAAPTHWAERLGVAAEVERELPELIEALLLGNEVAPSLTGMYVAPAPQFPGALVQACAQYACRHLVGGGVVLLPDPSDRPAASALRAHIVWFTVVHPLCEKTHERAHSPHQFEKVSRPPLATHADPAARDGLLLLRHFLPLILFLLLAFEE